MPTAWNQEAAKNSAQAWLIPSWWLPRTQGYLPGHFPRLPGSANPDCHGSSARLCKGSAVWKSSRLTIFLASRIKCFPSLARSQRQGERPISSFCPAKAPRIPVTRSFLLTLHFSSYHLPWVRGRDQSYTQLCSDLLHFCLRILTPALLPS